MTDGSRADFKMLERSLAFGFALMASYHLDARRWIRPVFQRASDENAITVHAMIPQPNIRLKLIPELSGDQCTNKISTNKIHMEALTSGNNIYANSQCHIYQNPFFTYYLHQVSDYKTGWNALCCGMYYILGGLLDGFGSACMSCCREFEGYRSIAWFW